MMRWIQFLIVCLLMSTHECGSHSLEFLSTGRRQPGDQPSFEQLTLFDGVSISYCNTSMNREQFKPTLESENLPEHCDNARQDILKSLDVIPPLVNSTVYVIQRRRGCKQSADGVVSASEAWAVNGMDFISFDPESQRWTSRSPPAIKVKQLWDTMRLINNDFTYFLTTECPRMIRKIKLKPVHQNTEVRIFAKPTENADLVLLTCHVTSTDRSVSTVHLIGDGASRVSWISRIGPMPSEDQSVILRLTAGISLSRNTDTYGCTVQTQGHNITVYWDGRSLDGRYFRYRSGVLWEVLILTIGLLGIAFLITLLSCATILLLKCVKTKKTRSASRVDPLLLEQLSRMSYVSPDLQNVIVSFSRGTERDKEAQDEWEVRIRFREQEHYDPEFNRRFQL